MKDRGSVKGCLFLVVVVVCTMSVVRVCEARVGRAVVGRCRLWATRLFVSGRRNFTFSGGRRHTGGHGLVGCGHPFGRERLGSGVRARALASHRSEYDTVPVEADAEAFCMRLEILKSSDGWIWEYRWEQSLRHRPRILIVSQSTPAARREVAAPERREWEEKLLGVEAVYL